MEIRPARQTDICAVEKIYSELFDFEENNGGCTNWKRGVYPTRDTAQKALSRGELFVLTDESGVAASMILNKSQPEFYSKINWAYPAEKDSVLLIHTLCVSPGRKKRGCGKAMVSFALSEAQKRGCTVMRLDTFEHNGPAAALYTGMGFSLAGSARVLHEGVIDETLILFEKEIAP